MSAKEQSYEFRDVVLAKVRGYPPWPGMVSALPLLFLTLRQYPAFSRARTRVALVLLSLSLFPKKKKLSLMGSRRVY